MLVIFKGNKKALWLRPLNFLFKSNFLVRVEINCVGGGAGGRGGGRAEGVFGFGSFSVLV